LLFSLNESHNTAVKFISSGENPDYHRTTATPKLAITGEKVFNLSLLCVEQFVSKKECDKGKWLTYQ